jgi:hypothetical protein
VGTRPARAGAGGTQGATVEPHTFTFVSNTGGVESGNKHSDAVAAKLKTAIGPLASQGTSKGGDRRAHPEGS